MPIKTMPVFNKVYFPRSYDFLEFSHHSFKPGYTGISTVLQDYILEDSKKHQYCPLVYVVRFGTTGRISFETVIYTESSIKKELTNCANNMACGLVYLH
jgi:hypothetical protein